MKKFVYWLIGIVAILFIAVYFTTTQYFFNRYIAPNIKEYGFSYTKVNGELLDGFRVKKLKYHNKLLSKQVVLKFNPLKLLIKRISISKLRLEDVDVKVLEEVLYDFKSNSVDSKSNQSIDLNFEIKNIFLSLKPFKIKDIDVNNAELKVNYISFINSKLDIADSQYYLNTSIGSVKFNGKFKNRILNIKSAKVTNLDINRLLKYKDSLIVNGKDSNNSNNLSIIFSLIPKRVVAKSIKLKLKPFKIDGFNTKFLEATIESFDYNTFKNRLKSAKLKLFYKSDIANILIITDLKEKLLTIKRADITILKLNKIISLIPKSNNSSNGNILLPFNKILVYALNLKIKDFKYKDAYFKNIKLSISNLVYNFSNHQIFAQSFALNSKNSIANIDIFGSIDSNTSIIDSASIENLDINKLVSLLSSNNNSTDTKIPLKVHNILLKNSLITIKPYKLNPVVFNSGKVNGKNLLFDIDKLSIKSGELDIKSDTSWGLVELKGNVKDNKYISKGVCKVNQNLLIRYNIPLISKNIKPLDINGIFGFDEFNITASLKGKNILKGIKDIDIIDSKNYIRYIYKKGFVSYKIDALINTPYTNRAKLKDELIYDGKLRYFGEVKPLKEVPFAKGLGDVFDNFKANYKGDSNHIEIYFKSKRLKGKLIDRDYNGGVAIVTNTTPINLKETFKIPLKQNIIISKLKVKSPINFNKLLPINGNIEVFSNLFNIGGEFNFNNEFNSNLLLKLSKNSILKSKSIKIGKLFPAKANLRLNSNRLELNLQNSLLNIDSKYILNSKDIDAKLKFDSLIANIKGDINRIKVDAKSSSVNKTISYINRILHKPIKQKIDGRVELKAVIDDLNRVSLNLSSPKIVIKGKQNDTKIENVTFKGEITKNLITINSYRFLANGYKIFSNKKSTISINKNNLNIKSLWINDSLLAKGRYDIKSLKGNFKLTSTGFKIENSDAKATISANGNLKIVGDKLSIDGNIKILNGVIKKNFAKKRVVDNEDIIILQRLQAKKSTKYAKNIKLNLKVNSIKPILYATSDSHFLLMPNLKIVKEFNSLTKISGKILLKKPSYYLMGDKKIYLKRGEIVFKGKNSIPYLNILMHYKGAEVDVNINVAGSASNPIIFFSSNPPLTKDQILAYLLFDDTSAVGTHSQEEMVGLIGGALAKSFLGSIGIKVDHLSIKENGFSIGKNIGKHIIIYYNQNEENPSIKTRINITNSVHTDIEISDQKQSADIVYSREY